MINATSFMQINGSTPRWRHVYDPHGMMLSQSPDFASRREFLCRREANQGRFLERRKKENLSHEPNVCVSCITM